MGVTDKVWDTFARVIKMDDQVERLASTVVRQQEKIENLTERLIRLEATLDIALRTGNIPRTPSERTISHTHDNLEHME